MRTLAASLTVALVALVGSEPGLRADGPLDAIAEQIKARKYEEASQAARVALAGFEAEGRGETLDAARALDLIVEAAWRGGLAEGGRAGGERAVAIRERLLGANDASVATSLHLLGNLCHGRGEAVAARGFYERSLAIRERVFGPEAAEIVPSLNNLGNVTRGLGDLEASQRLLERALAIREKLLPPTSRDLVRSHVSLGNTLSDRGDLLAAEHQLRRAVAILDAQSARDPQMSSALNTLSVALDRLGRLDEAEAVLRRALTIEREAAGESADLAMFTGNLAVMRRDLGDWAEARTLQEEALRLQSAAPHPDPTHQALLLNNLGYLFLLMSDPSGAEPILEDALEIRRRVMPADHRLIAQNLQNLGHAHGLRGNLEEARASYEQAVGILERTVGTRHREYADAVVDLATVLQAQGRWTEAAELALSAIPIYRETVGPGSLAAVRAQVLVADVRLALGDAAEARAGFEQALDALRASYGPAHPVAVEVLARLASSLATLGDTARALDASIESTTLEVENTRAVLPVLPERQALALADVPDGLHVALSIASRSGESDAVRRAWAALVRARGLLLEELVRRARAGSAARHAGAVDLTQELDRARSRLVRLLLAVPERIGGAEQQRRAVDLARREAERLEQALADASGVYKQERMRSAPTLQELADALPDGAVLVAYAHHREVRVGPVRQERAAPSGVPGSPVAEAYCAFVLDGAGAEPRIVPLGSAALIDRLVADWRREATAPALAGVRRDSEARYEAAALALRKAVWDPVRGKLAAAKLAFVVPDGALQIVSFASLPASRSRFLAETGPRIHLLTAERDLVQSEQAAPGHGLLVIAAPEYDSDPGSLEPDPRGLSNAAAESPIDVVRLRSVLERGAGDRRFVALPGSRHEAQRVVEAWSRGREKGQAAVAIDGARASERAFRAEAPGKRMLHVATHGFFLDPKALGGPTTEYGARALDEWSRSGLGYVAVENPLLTSGLALAGANRTLAGDQAAAAADGLLLAHELAALDLRGVEWLVLSACETGIGDIVPGAGVVGLRHAALAAGTGTVLMSLWHVEDAATAEWMHELYRARLDQGAATAVAVTSAHRAVLERRRRDGRSTHPFYWAAFVAAGDWR